jgi:hypothetical protein
MCSVLGLLNIIDDDSKDALKPGIHHASDDNDGA